MAVVEETARATAYGIQETAEAVVAADGPVGEAAASNAAVAGVVAVAVAAELGEGEVGVEDVG